MRLYGYRCFFEPRPSTVAHWTLHLTRTRLEAGDTYGIELRTCNPALAG